MLSRDTCSRSVASVAVSDSPSLRWGGTTKTGGTVGRCLARVAATAASFSVSSDSGADCWAAVSNAAATIRSASAGCCRRNSAAVADSRGRTLFSSL